ncbi:VRR-NUC domain-containing protein [Treponema primitia]|uniref:hypothetical protein n=1 Tax=Treponema primitia TaxID=88058 RepID=UPI00397EED13
MTEHSVQSACLDWLASRNIKAWRRNIGVAFYQNADGTPRPVRYNKKGMSDITGVCSVYKEFVFEDDEGEYVRALPVPGIRLEIEVKRPGEVPTKEQTAFIDMINREGSVGIWADSIDMLEAKLKEKGVIYG